MFDKVLFVVGWFRSGLPPAWSGSSPTLNKCATSYQRSLSDLIAKRRALLVPDVCELRGPAIPVRAGSGESFALQLETRWCDNSAGR